MKILRIYIPLYRAKREARFFACLNLWSKHEELIRFMNIPLDEKE